MNNLNRNHSEDSGAYRFFSIIRMYGAFTPAVRDAISPSRGSLKPNVMAARTRYGVSPYLQNSGARSQPNSSASVNSASNSAHSKPINPANVLVADKKAASCPNPRRARCSAIRAINASVGAAPSTAGK